MHSCVARLWPPEWAKGEREREREGAFFKGRERERGEKLCNSPGYFSLSNERAHLSPSLPLSLSRPSLSFLCALHLPHLTILTTLSSIFLSSIFLCHPLVLKSCYILYCPPCLMGHVFVYFPRPSITSEAGQTAMEGGRHSKGRQPMSSPSNDSVAPCVSQIEWLNPPICLIPYHPLCLCFSMALFPPLFSLRLSPLVPHLFASQRSIFHRLRRRVGTRAAAAHLG